MKRKVYTAAALALVLLLLLSAGVLAMSSPGFLLNWYVLLSGGGGGRSSSPSYRADYTVGQSAAGPISGSYTSPGYSARLGYWTGAGGEYDAFLPMIRR